MESRHRERLRCLCRLRNHTCVASAPSRPHASVGAARLEAMALCWGTSAATQAYARMLAIQGDAEDEEKNEERSQGALSRKTNATALSTATKASHMSGKPNAKAFVSLRGVGFRSSQKGLSKGGVGQAGPKSEVGCRPKSVWPESARNRTGIGDAGAC